MPKQSKSLAAILTLHNEFTYTKLLLLVMHMKLKTTLMNNPMLSVYVLLPMESLWHFLVFALGRCPVACWDLKECVLSLLWLQIKYTRLYT